jgi:NAD:arginine ADP-ribosyltransferase
MDWEPQNECLYVVLNATLRSIDRQKLKPWFLYLRLFLNGFMRLPTINRTIYRGVKMDLSHGYTVGEIILWWGFSSCTMNMKTLQSEQLLGKAGTRTMFAIETLSGRNIRGHSMFQTEDEVLIPPATQFKVVACLDQSDLKIIQLEEIEALIELLEPVPIIPPGIVSKSRKNLVRKI